MTKQRKTCVAFIIAAVLVLAVSVPSALAFFSTYTRVKGGAPVILQETVTFTEEENDSGDKRIKITVDKDSDPVFVRVGVYASEDILNRIEADNTWQYDGTWYTYNSVLKAGETAELNLEVDKVNLDTDEFNIVVVHEYIPAILNEAGEYVPDWNAKWIGGGE